MRKSGFYFIMLLMIVSCAGFKNNDSMKMDKDNVKNITGTYRNLPATPGGFYVRTLSDVFDRNTNMFKWKEKYSHQNVIVKLELIKKNRLHVEIADSENFLFSKDLRVKLKKDGYLYLKEKRLMIDGIPLVFGGWNIQKSRFAIDADQNLIIQSNYFFCNGIFILMSDWKMFHYHLTFEKI
ncbi:hypothetical protein ASG31_11015 [Chryseobacterium sp. Leaf404]|uniref:hypothetical protein n=1 Tax=unclassified Chryseobacterium TaxID=2593645 RepID=UPI0006F3E05E|nr:MULTISPECIES: hypothetical protein [unclassified Chryseobacterium]KQT16895.1 hypothetical protein ASG31_11015 [Chryseobacterium sp. Leaf404]